MKDNSLFKKLFYNRIMLLILPICMWQLYAWHGFPYILCKMAGFISGFILLFASLNLIIKRKSQGSYFLVKDISNIILCLIISWCTALVFWNQSIDGSYRSSIDVINLCFFFYLINGRFSKENVIRMIIYLGVLNIILWGYALSMSPLKVFGYLGFYDSDEYVINRGIARISLPGQNFQILLYYYALVKCFRKNNKFFWIIASVLLFCISCSTMTRMKIATILLVSVYYFFSINKFKVKGLTITIMVLCACFAIANLYFHSYIDLLLSLTIEQFTGNVSKQDDGFYRLHEYYFFFIEFKNNLLTSIFGNGFPSHSDLGTYINSLKVKGYYPDDVAFASLYIYMGVVGLIMYLRMFTHSIFKRVSSDIIFVKLTLIYILISSITLMNIYDSVTISTCLYLIWIDNKQKQTTSIR